MVWRVGGVVPDGCHPGQHPPVRHLLDGVQATAQDRASSPNELGKSLSVPVCAAPCNVPPFYLLMTPDRGFQEVVANGQMDFTYFIVDTVYPPVIYCTVDG